MPDVGRDKSRPVRAVILGAGAIGSDLMFKIIKSDRLDCAMVVGRRPDSAGLQRAAKIGLPVSADGLAALLAAPDSFDLVFDCTNAAENRKHWEALSPLGKCLVNLTPSLSGHMVVPAVNGATAAINRNLNMVSCGGQAAVPVLAALARTIPDMSYVEIVTTAASKSVGMGTRANLDEYIAVTCEAAKRFARVGDVKAMVNLSPARPPATFRVTALVVAEDIDIDRCREEIGRMAHDVRAYCRGYLITECRIRPDGVLVVTAEIDGGQDFLPAFAGNLEVINQAAIFAAEQII